MARYIVDIEPSTKSYTQLVVPITVEEIHKELDLIQGCISRMANNSFFMKGWLISVYAVVMALIDDNSNIALASMTLIMVTISFWWLDSFFLQTEKAYREIYSWVLIVRPVNNRDYLYDLNTHKRRIGIKPADSLGTVMFSKILRVFYGIPLFCAFFLFGL